MYLVVLIDAMFFVISVVTNILGAIIPDLIDTFGLTLTEAALLPFAFFIAYGTMSIPAGLLVERFREKVVIEFAWLLGLAGSLAIALFPAHGVVMVSLFSIGFGMAALQVTINPLLRVAGGAGHFAFHSALAQLVFGSASFLAPRIYSHMSSWVSLYWLFAAMIAVMLAVVAVSRFPRVERTEEERAGSWKMHAALFRNRVVLLYFVSVFAYVGSEQGTSVWISKFLATYHHCDPRTTGALAVSWFWGLLTAGCLAGMLLLKFFDSRRLLMYCAAGAAASLTLALFGSRAAALAGFPLIGLFASIMWPVIVSLALNSVSKAHGSVSGILCTAIAGGAVVPLIIGQISDHLGLRAGMMFLYVTFGWIFSIGLWARPLIANKTITRRKRQPALKASGQASAQPV